MTSQRATMPADLGTACATAPRDTVPSLLPLIRLLQLASPTLPIGAYSYSQGIEWVVEDGVIHDAASTREWIGDVLDFVVARGEAAMAWRMLTAARGEDWQALAVWNDRFRTSRETAELRAETEQMGSSLTRLVSDLDLLDEPARNAAKPMAPITLPAAFSLAARGFAVPIDAALAAYVWSWLESQVLAAMKLVPLGQVTGQRLLVTLGAKIPAVVVAAMTLADDDLSTFAPGLALASARHETQYTRLFRS